MIDPNSIDKSNESKMIELIKRIKSKGSNIKKHLPVKRSNTVFIILEDPRSRRFDFDKARHHDVICLGSTVNFAPDPYIFITTSYSTVLNKVNYRNAQHSIFILNTSQSSIKEYNKIYYDTKLNLIYKDLDNFDFVYLSNKVKSNILLENNLANFVNGNSSVISAIQLAYLMDYKEINIVGFDKFKNEYANNILNGFFKHRNDIVIKYPEINHRKTVVKMPKRKIIGENKSKKVSNIIDAMGKDKINNLSIHIAETVPIKKNDTLYIIGGGPSVKKHNLNLLKGDKMVINRAIEYVDEAEYFITMDYTFVRNKVDMFEVNKKAKHKVFVINKAPYIESHKNIFYDKRNTMLYEKLNEFDSVFLSNKEVDNTKGFGNTVESFVHGANSGFCALQLGLLMEYSKIVLIGIDLEVINNETHFHGGYGENTINFARKLDKYSLLFQKALSNLDIRKKKTIYTTKKEGVINKFCSYIELNEGEVNFNTKVNKNHIMNHLIIVGYYTENTPYEAEARKTIDSCKKLNLNYHIEGIRNLGSWQANTRYKATFMLDMLNKFPDKTLLYIDCDAVINEVPILFNKNYNTDIAVRWQDFRWRKNECLSGTIYMENNDINRKLCKTWININNRDAIKTKVYEQWNLGKAIIKMREQGLRDKILPPEYCQFDLIERIYPNLKRGRGVIQHFQKSRVFKTKIDNKNV